MLEERATISYCISGLAARDQIVFKSLMRLLSPRLSHAWVYEPKGVLAVVGDPAILDKNLSLETHRQAIEVAQIVLSVGIQRNNDIHFLRLPFQANLMEVQLNAIGNEIATLQKSGLQKTSPWPSRSSIDTQPIVLPRPAAETQEQVLTAKFAGKLSLKRWPSKNLLTSQAHIRMATLLLRPHTSVQEFLKINAPTPDLALQFLQELHAHDFLKIELQAVPTSVPTLAAAQPQAPKKELTSPSLGLLSRIRQRLGI
jgi:hypothetical protein